VFIPFSVTQKNSNMFYSIHFCFRFFCVRRSTIDVWIIFQRMVLFSVVVPPPASCCRGLALKNAGCQSGFIIPSPPNPLAHFQADGSHMSAPLPPPWAPLFPLPPPRPPGCTCWRRTRRGAGPPRTAADGGPLRPLGGIGPQFGPPGGGPPSIIVSHLSRGERANHPVIKSKHSAGGCLRAKPYLSKAEISDPLIFGNSSNNSRPFFDLEKEGAMVPLAAPLKKPEQAMRLFGTPKAPSFFGHAREHNDPTNRCRLGPPAPTPTPSASG